MERNWLRDITISELQDFLAFHGVTTIQWGQGESKLIIHLLHELHTGESILRETEDGKLLRIVRGVGVNVFYKNGTRVLKLHEEKQVFEDGRTRKRDLPTSVGEKMSPEELPNKAAERALREELNVSANGLSQSYFIEDREVVPSTSFPGLYTKNTIYVFNCFVSDEDYKPEGYTEVQPDKINYYIWREIPTE